MSKYTPAKVIGNFMKGFGIVMGTTGAVGYFYLNGNVDDIIRMVASAGGYLLGSYIVSDCEKQEICEKIEELQSGKLEEKIKEK